MCNWTRKFIQAEATNLEATSILVAEAVTLTNGIRAAIKAS